MVPKNIEINDTVTVASAPKIVEARRPPGFVQKYALNKWTYHVPSSPISPKEIKGNLYGRCHRRGSGDIRQGGGADRGAGGR